MRTTTEPLTEALHDEFPKTIRCENWLTIREIIRSTTKRDGVRLLEHSPRLDFAES